MIDWILEAMQSQMKAGHRDLELYIRTWKRFGYISWDLILNIWRQTIKLMRISLHPILCYPRGIKNAIKTIDLKCMHGGKETV